MVTNKKTHIIYRSIFLVISLIGCIWSLFNGSKYNPDFYLYFTNISNYLCFGIILTLFIDDVKKYKKGVKNEASSLAPNFRLSVCVMIIITFLVYNTILNNPFHVEYWINIRSVILHLICPVMFVVDFMLFSKKRNISIRAPFLALIIPALYVFYILIRAEVYVGTGKMVYPYFFLNGYEIGWGVVALYIVGIAAIVLVLGFALWAFDKLVRSDDGKLKWDFSPLPKPEPVAVVSEVAEEKVNNEEEKVENEQIVKVEENTIEEKNEDAKEKPKKTRTKKVEVEKKEESAETAKPKRGRPKKSEE